MKYLATMIRIDTKNKISSRIKNTNRFNLIAYAFSLKSDSYVWFNPYVLLGSFSSIYMHYDTSKELYGREYKNLTGINKAFLK
jgi:hypothetical protein